MLSDEQQQQIKAERKKFGGIIKKGDPLYKNGFKVMVAFIAIPLILLYELICFCYEQLTSAYTNRYELVQVLKTWLIQIYTIILNLFKKLFRLFYSVLKAITNIFKLVIWRYFAQIVKICVSIWHMIDYISNVMVNNFDKFMNLYATVELIIVKIAHYITALIIDKCKAKCVLLCNSIKNITKQVFEKVKYHISRTLIFSIGLIDKYIVQTIVRILTAICKNLKQIWLCFINILSRVKRTIKKYIRKSIKITLLCLTFGIYTLTQALCIINKYSQIIFSKLERSSNFQYILFTGLIYPIITCIGSIWIVFDQFYQQLKMLVKKQCQRVKSCYLNMIQSLKTGIQLCKQKFVLICNRIYNKICESIGRIMQFIQKVLKNTIIKIYQMIKELLVILRNAIIRSYKYLKAIALRIALQVWSGIKWIYTRVLNLLVILRNAIIRSYKYLKAIAFRIALKGWSGIKWIYARILNYLHKLTSITLKLVINFYNLIEQKIYDPVRRYSIYSYKFIQDKIVQLSKFIKKIILFQVKLFLKAVQYLKKQLLQLLYKLQQLARKVGRVIRSIISAICNFIMLKQQSFRKFFYNMCSLFFMISIRLSLKGLDLIDRLIQIQLNVINFIFKYTVYVFRVVYRYLHKWVAYVYRHVKSAIKQILGYTINATKYLAFITILYVKPIIQSIAKKIKLWIRIAFIDTSLVIIGLTKQIIKASKFIYHEYLIPIIQYSIKKIISIKTIVRHQIYIGLIKIIEVLKMLTNQSKSLFLSIKTQLTHIRKAMIHYLKVIGIQVKGIFISLKNYIQHIISLLIEPLQWLKNQMFLLYKQLKYALIEIKVSIINFIQYLFQQMKILQQSISNQMNIIKQYIYEVLMPLKESIAQQFTSLKMNIISFKNSIIAGINDMRQYLSSNLIQPIKKSIAESFQTIKEILQNMKLRVSEFTQSLISSIKQIKQNLTQQIKSYKTAIQDLVRSLRGR